MGNVWSGANQECWKNPFLRWGGGLHNDSFDSDSVESLDGYRRLPLQPDFDPHGPVGDDGGISPVCRSIRGSRKVSG